MGITKLERLENKRIVKHAPLKSYVHNELDHTVYIQSKTPYISAIKRINKVIAKYEKIPNKRGESISRGNVSNKVRFITVKGLGKSIPKTLNIGVHFKVENSHKVEILTKTVNVLDEFVDKDEAKNMESGHNEDESDDESILRKRSVGAVQIRIYL